MDSTLPPRPKEGTVEYRLWQSAMRMQQGLAASERLESVYPSQFTLIKGGSTGMNTGFEGDSEISGSTRGTRATSQTHIGTSAALFT